MAAQDKKPKKPLKKMGHGSTGERDTRLEPYRREKINPRDLSNEDDDEPYNWENDGDQT